MFSVEITNHEFHLNITRVQVSCQITVWLLWTEFCAFVSDVVSFTDLSDNKWSPLVINYKNVSNGREQRKNNNKQLQRDLSFNKSCLN